MLSLNSAKRLMVALADQVAGNEVAGILNNGVWGMPAAIVAAHTSTTTDFGALLKGDLLVHIPAVAGNSAFEVVATNGTKPSAAVVGDLYVVIRLAAPLANTL